MKMTSLSNTVKSESSFSAKGISYSMVEISKKDENLLWLWHKEHVKINFPEQKPDKRLFLKDLKSGGQKYIIVNSDNRKIGFVWFDLKKNLYEKEIEGVIRYIQIDKTQRKKGIGKTVLKHVGKILKKCGASFITLGTRTENTAASKLYESLGYKPIRIVYRKNLR